MGKENKPAGMSCYEFIHGRPNPNRRETKATTIDDLDEIEVPVRDEPRYDIGKLQLEEPRWKTDEERRQFFERTYLNIRGNYRSQLKEIAYMIDNPAWFKWNAKYIIPDVYKSDEQDRQGLDFLAEIVLAMRNNLFTGSPNDVDSLQQQLTTKANTLVYGSDIIEDTFTLLNFLKLTEEDNKNLPTLIQRKVCAVTLLKHLHNHPEAFVLIGIDPRRPGEIDELTHDLPRMLEVLENIDEHRDLASRITAYVENNGENANEY